jgi:hypothetical protein
VVEQVRHDAIRVLRQVHAIPAEVLIRFRAHRRARRAAHPVHVDVIRPTAGTTTRLGDAPLVEPCLASILEHLHVGVEVVGVGDRRGRVLHAQLTDLLLQQHVMHLREEV